MNILSVFSCSTFNPIQLHMEKMVEAVAYLPNFLEAIYDTNWKNASVIQQKMEKSLKQANTLKHQILQQSALSAFKPLQNRDVFELILAQSNIAKMVQNIMHMILDRKLTIPHVVADNYYGFIQACLYAAEKAKKLVDELENLLKAGSSSAYNRALQCMLLDLDTLVSEAAFIHQEIKKEILILEKNLMATDTHYLYKIFEETEKIAAEALLIGQQLQLLVA